MFGRAPRTSFRTLASSFGRDRKLGVIDLAALQRHIKNAVEARTVLRKKVGTKIQSYRERQNEGARGGRLPNIAVVITCWCRGLGGKVRGPSS